DSGLGRIVRERVADGGGQDLTGHVARDRRVGGGDEGAGRELRELDDVNVGGNDARDLDEVEVADACRQQGVVEGVVAAAASRLGERSERKWEGDVRCVARRVR